jgi:hypothetical protein
LRRVIAAWCALGVSEAGASDACEAPVDAAAIEGALASAVRAFESLDDAGFRRAVDAAVAGLPCVRAPVTPALAARYHRIIGLDRYLANDGPAAAAAAAASRVIEPTFQFDDAFLPPGHPYRLAIEGFDASSGAFREVAAPTTGALWFDGVPGTRRPLSWSTIQQVVDAGDVVVDTAYVFPEDALLSYPGAEPAVAPVVPDARAHRARAPLLIAAGALGVASAVTYGIAGAKARTYDDLSQQLTREQLGALRAQTNGLVVVSGVLVGATAVSGSLAVVF